MKPISSAWLIQIEVTNGCIHNCSHCTRAVPHIKKPFFADLDFIDRALHSLKNWKHGIGCMGGEPTIHPKFPEICELYKKHIPQKKRRGLWTSGGKKYKEHKKLIDETFGIINFNDHVITSFHQPVMAGAEEIIKDEKLRDRLIDDCWLQRTWSPTITPRGGFFCEVASTFDLLLDGNEGFPIEVDWWKKSIKDCKNQRDKYCSRCSIAIPMKTYPDTLSYDIVSKKNAEMLRNANSPLALNGKLEIREKEITKDDIIELRKSDEFRKPEQYSEAGTEHFYAINPLEFSQKFRNIPYWFKSKINNLFF